VPPFALVARPISPSRLTRLSKPPTKSFLCSTTRQHRPPSWTRNEQQAQPDRRRSRGPAGGAGLKPSEIEVDPAAQTSSGPIKPSAPAPRTRPPLTAADGEAGSRVGGATVACPLRTLSIVTNDAPACVALRSPPTRPGRTPLAVDSDRPAASAGTLPSGRYRNSDAARFEPDRDDRIVAEGAVGLTVPEKGKRSSSTSATCLAPAGPTRVAFTRDRNWRVVRLTVAAVGD
jgi:hypothetical protein